MPGDQQRDKAVLGVSDITFVSESQPENNNSSLSRQRKRTRRRKAPIYWGKKPNRRKSEVKRKLDSELEHVENGEHAVSDTEDNPANSGEEGMAGEEVGEDTENMHDMNCDDENNATDHQEEEEEDEVELMENGDMSVNGDVVLLDSNNLESELNNDDLNSESLLQKESENASHSPKESQKNYVLFEKVSSLPNGITSDVCLEEKECDVGHIGKSGSNSISFNNGRILLCLKVLTTFHNSYILTTF